MPELPEVELVTRYLRPLLQGRTIRSVSTSAPSYFFLTAPTRLRRQLPRESIEALERQGKYLIVSLSSGRRLVLHLGMTGQLVLEGAESPRLALGKHSPPRTSRGEPSRNPAESRRFLASRGRFGAEPDPHTHLSIEFTDGGPPLHFRDTRKFGKVRLLEREETDRRLSKLGPDALELSAETLYAASRKRRLRIKSLLLDQSVTAGIGNIYADESLFGAGIHPERPASTLTEDECRRLASVVRRILRRSIRAGGSSIDDYVHPDGSDGSYQRRFLVYGRKGQPCRKCGTLVQRLVIGQRSSHCCPQCQK